MGLARSTTPRYESWHKREKCLEKILQNGKVRYSKPSNVHMRWWLEWTYPVAHLCKSLRRKHAPSVQSTKWYCSSPPLLDFADACTLSGVPRSVCSSIPWKFAPLMRLFRLPIYQSTAWKFYVGMLGICPRDQIPEHLSADRSTRENKQ